MKELSDLLLDMENYIVWIKHISKGVTRSDFPEENTRRLLTEILGYDSVEEIVFVEKVNSQSAETDPTVKFLLISGEFSKTITRENLEDAGRQALGYGSNLFLYTNGPDIKVFNIEIEEGKPELEAMMEFNVFEDEPSEIVANLWPLSKKDCGKKVLVVIY